MNTPSGSRGDAAPAPGAAHAGPGQVLVWDAPVRVFHGLMVVCFAGAYLTAESERWRLVHVTLGYTMAGLVAFRLLGGFVGTQHARFASFVRGPAAVLRPPRRPGRAGHGAQLGGGAGHRRTAGHGGSGHRRRLGDLQRARRRRGRGTARGRRERDAGPRRLACGGRAGRLVAAPGEPHRAMVTGRKRAPPEEAIGEAWCTVAGFMLAAVLAFWWLQA